MKEGTKNIKKPNIDNRLKLNEIPVAMEQRSCMRSIVVRISRQQKLEVGCIISQTTQSGIQEE